MGAEPKEEGQSLTSEGIVLQVVIDGHLAKAFKAIAEKWHCTFRRVSSARRTYGTFCRVRVRCNSTNVPAVLAVCRMAGMSRGAGTCTPNSDESGFTIDVIVPEKLQEALCELFRAVGARGTLLESE